MTVDVITEKTTKCKHPKKLWKPCHTYDSILFKHNRGTLSSHLHGQYQWQWTTNKLLISLTVLVAYFGLWQWQNTCESYAEELRCHSISCDDPCKVMHYLQWVLSLLVYATNVKNTHKLIVYNSVMEIRFPELRQRHTARMDRVWVWIWMWIISMAYSYSALSRLDGFRIETCSPWKKWKGGGDRVHEGCATGSQRVNPSQGCCYNYVRYTWQVVMGGNANYCKHVWHNN